MVKKKTPETVSGGEIPEIVTDLEEPEIIPDEEVSDGVSVPKEQVNENDVDLDSTDPQITSLVIKQGDKVVSEGEDAI